MENWHGHSVNELQGLTTFRESYSRALEHGPLVPQGDWELRVEICHFTCLKAMRSISGLMVYQMSLLHDIFCPHDTWLQRAVPLSRFSLKTSHWSLLKTFSPISYSESWRKAVLNKNIFYGTAFRVTNQDVTLLNSRITNLNDGHQNEERRSEFHVETPGFLQGSDSDSAPLLSQVQNLIIRHIWHSTHVSNICNKIIQSAVDIVLSHSGFNATFTESGARLFPRFHQKFSWQFHWPVGYTTAAVQPGKIDITEETLEKINKTSRNSLVPHSVHHIPGWLDVKNWSFTFV